MGSYFRLENKEEAKLFEIRLKEYYQLRTEGFHCLPYLNLLDWFEYCQDFEKDGRLFTMIFDLKLNLIYLDIGLVIAKKIFYNKLINSTESNILSNNDEFSSRLDLLNKLSDYVIRYRALMDKLMGLLVMFYAPDNYDNFRRAKSRKKAFKSIFEEVDLPLNLDIEKVFQYLEKFDSKFRTPEIHATGALRKKLLLSSKDSYKEFMEIGFDSWNKLIEFISEVSKIAMKRKDIV